MSEFFNASVYLVDRRIDTGTVVGWRSPEQPVTSLAHSLPERVVQRSLRAAELPTRPVAEPDGDDGEPYDTREDSPAS
jgi:hypothetical protein